MDYLETRKGKIQLPVFMPDATRATIKNVDSAQIKDAGVRMLVSNTFHLMLRPGSEVVKKMGGLHKFMNWDGPILTDSGGFQVFSLIHKRGLGEVTDKGAKFKSPIDGTPQMLTPESSIDIQMNLDSDILVVLDEPIPVETDEKRIMLSVDRTTAWAERAKKQFLSYPKEEREGKKIFCVVQGGLYPKLREQSAKELNQIGFDGFGFGGWPIDNEGNRLDEILKITAEVIPDEFPKYAMGVGMPEDIAYCKTVGYTMFDCVIPTRNARHGFIFVSEGNGGEQKEGYEVIRLQNSSLIEDQNPLDKNCDCYTCQNYSRAYLSHLFRVKEPLARTLATIHNLKFFEDWEK